jgi:chromosome segregation ATPase
MRVATLLLALTLPACSTVQGWLGLDGTADAPAATAKPAVAAKNGAAERRAAEAAAAEADAAARKAREDAIRQEIRQLEADAKSGKVSLKDARRRIDALKAELEDVVRPAAAAGAKAKARETTREPGALAQRVSDLESRLAKIEEQLARIEERLGETGR